MRQILYLFRQFFSQRKKQQEVGIEQGYAPTLLRDDKARKILTVLSQYLNAEVAGKRILDIGSGNGEISLYLANAGGIVTSVDVQPPQVELPNFIKLTSAYLPFEDKQFDIVVYNMVMEHLAQESDQMLQLREIYRVLKSDGCCYIAQPNRIFPMEAHTRIWFLHWLPNLVWFRLAKKLGKYQENIYLHGYFKLKKMFREAGFEFEEYTAKIIANPTFYSMNMFDRAEKRREEKRIQPGKLLHILQPLSPSNVFVLYKKRGVKKKAETYTKRIS